MNNLLPYIVIIVIIGGMFLLIFNLVRREWQVTDQFAEFVIQRGWKLQEHPEVRRAFLIKSSDADHAWQIELFRSSRHQPALTEWKSGSVEWTHDSLIIGVKIAALLESQGEEPLDEDKFNQLGGELLTRTSGWGALPAPGPWGFLRLGIDPRDLTTQQVGSKSFQQVYDVLSASLAPAQQLLTEPVENQLLSWPELNNRKSAPVVIANQEGLSVRIPNDKGIKQNDLLERQVELGLALEKAVLG